MRQNQEGYWQRIGRKWVREEQGSGVTPRLSVCTMRCKVRDTGAEAPLRGQMRNLDFHILFKKSKEK